MLAYTSRYETVGNDPAFLPTSDTGGGDYAEHFSLLLFANFADACVKVGIRIDGEY